MQKLNCSMQQFNDSVIMFRKHGHLNQHKRLGQYIHETHVIDGVSWPELYYEENDNFVIGMVTVECIMYSPIVNTVDESW